MWTAFPINSSKKLMTAQYTAKNQMMSGTMEHSTFVHEILKSIKYFHQIIFFNTSTHYSAILILNVHLMSWLHVCTRLLCFTDFEGHQTCQLDAKCKMTCHTLWKSSETVEDKCSETVKQVRFENALWMDERAFGNFHTSKSPKDRMQDNVHCSMIGFTAK